LRPFERGINCWETVKLFQTSKVSRQLLERYLSLLISLSDSASERVRFKAAAPSAKAEYEQRFNVRSHPRSQTDVCLTFAGVGRSWHNTVCRLDWPRAPAPTIGDTKHIVYALPPAVKL